MASKAKDASRNAALSAEPAAEAYTKWDTSTKAGQFARQTLVQALDVLQRSASAVCLSCSPLNTFV